MTNTKHAAATPVLGLHAVDRSQTSVVGGKAANLGELSRIPGIDVPPGVCVTTGVFQQLLETTPALHAPLERLCTLAADDRDGIREHSGELRRILEATPVPEYLEAALTRALAEFPADTAWAVRSSATAEDLPRASFAGQQDTFLNVRGPRAIADHIRRCWASLFSERAVTYRIQHGFDHRKVHMAVVVQRMVSPRAAGIVFTADPITGDRTITSIEAVFGLGESLVSGQTNADRYKLRHTQILNKTIARDTDTQVLTDPQILALAQVARQIEHHFGCPQDIEWCLADDHTFKIVQSRPITTLYPIPQAGAPGHHVYISVGHQQMMTDAMKPLGLSIFQKTAAGIMHAAGGRLFVDTARQLASPTGRDPLLKMLGNAHPQLRDALLSVLETGFVEPSAEPGPAGRAAAPTNTDNQPEDDPALVTELIDRSEAALAELKHTIIKFSGPALFDFIAEDTQRMKQTLFEPRSMAVIMAAMNAYAWINETMREWLGEKNAADTLTQSVPHNITSQMGLDLMAVADAIRPWPAVVAHLQRTTRDNFLNDLPELDGGPQARDAINAFLEKYGMRCAGEIDLTRPRWREKPSMLLLPLLGNIHNFGPGAGLQKFEQGLRDAQQRTHDLLAQILQLPDGQHRAVVAKRMIDRLRNLSGYREYPKYGLVSRYFVYKQALLREADQLVQTGVLRDREDVYHLTFDELHEVVRTRQLDEQLLTDRKAEHELFKKLTPPLVITSDGEVVTGAHSRTDAPAGALVGLAVSSGVVEGRARVILDMAAADLEPGDILVTTFTDPSWTPLFVTIKALVTEVGGLMTHGAVIAREYGLPAVVGVTHATTKIRDGQRVRVNGTDGYVEILMS